MTAFARSPRPWASLAGALRAALGMSGAALVLAFAAWFLAGLQPEPAGPLPATPRALACTGIPYGIYVDPLRAGDMTYVGDSWVDGVSVSTLHMWVTSFSGNWNDCVGYGQKYNAIVWKRAYGSIRWDWGRWTNKTLSDCDGGWVAGQLIHATPGDVCPNDTPGAYYLPVEIHDELVYQGSWTDGWTSLDTQPAGSMRASFTRCAVDMGSAFEVERPYWHTDPTWTTTTGSCVTSVDGHLSMAWVGRDWNAPVIEWGPICSPACNAWTKQNVLVIGSSYDGVNDSPGRWTYSVPEGGWVATGTYHGKWFVWEGNYGTALRICDAFRCADSGWVSIRIDKTAPAVGAIDLISTNANYDWGGNGFTNGTSATINWRTSSSDNLSGATSRLYVRSAPLANNACGTWSDHWQQAISSALDTTYDTALTLSDDTCYLVHVQAVDGAANYASTAEVAIYVDQTGVVLTGPTLTPNLSGYTQAASVAATYTTSETTSFVAGSGLRYQTAPLANDACGTWTGFTGFTSPLTLTDATCYKIRTWATNAPNVTTTLDSAEIRVDRTAPAWTSNLEPSADAWRKAGDAVSFTWSGASDSGAGLAASPYAVALDTAPLSGGACGAISNGSFAATAATSTTVASPANATCYRVRVYALDNAGNVTTTRTSAWLKVDTVAPTSGTPRFVESHTALHASGTTLWYRPSGVAAATVGITFDPAEVAGAEAPTDAASGIASVAFPALGGMGTGATDGPQTDTASPYRTTGAVYTFGSGAVTTSGSKSITITDAVTNVTTSSVSILPDAAAPSWTANLTPAADTWVGPATDITFTWDAATDAGSGLPASPYQVALDTAPLSGGACGAITSGSFVATSATSHTISSPTGATCYRVRVYGTDNVGNTTATGTSGWLRLDTVDPTSGTPRLAETEAALHGSGTTLYYAPAAAQGRAFAITFDPADVAGAVAPTDAHSGVGSVTFPTIAGMGTGASAGPQVDAASPYKTSGTVYTFGSGAVTASGAQTVTVADNAGNTAATSITLTPDAAAPTWTANLTPASDTWRKGGDALTFTWGTATDGGSGLTAAPYETWTDTAPLAAGSCGAVTPGSQVDTASTSTTIASPTSGTCYRLRVRATDKVDNKTATATSAWFMYDSTAPTTGAVRVVESDDALYAVGSTLWYTPYNATDRTFVVTFDPADGATAPTDAGSGIESVAFPTVTGIGTGGHVGPLTDTTAPYETVASTTYQFGTDATISGPQTVTISDRAGNTATATFTFAQDVTPPSWSPTFTPSSDEYRKIGDSLTFSWTDGRTDADTAVKPDYYATLETAPLVGGVCGTMVTGASFWITGETYTISSPAPDTCHRLMVRAVDEVWMALWNRTPWLKYDATAPAAGTIRIQEADAGIFVAGGTTLWYRPDAVNGLDFMATFDSTDVAGAVAPTDAQSGIVAVDFPLIGGLGSGAVAGPQSDAVAPYKTSGGVYTFGSSPTASGVGTVVIRDAAGNTTDTTFSVNPDSTAPTPPVVSCLPAAACGGIWNDLPEVTITPGDSTDAESGLHGYEHSLDGGTTWIPGTEVVVIDEGATVVEWRATDNVGNESPPTTVTVRLDRSDPLLIDIHITEASRFMAVDDASDTLWHRSVTPADEPFTVHAEASDIGSGIDFVTFPALACLGSALDGPRNDHVPDGVSGLYDSAPDYAFGAVHDCDAVTGPVFVTDEVGRTSDSLDVTLRLDDTPPSGAFTFEGRLSDDCDPADPRIGSDIWSNTTEVTVCASGGFDAGAGATYWYTTDGTDPATSPTASEGDHVTIPDEGITDVRFVLVDLVGNVSDEDDTFIVKLDRTLPSVPDIDLVEPDPYAWQAGTNGTVTFNGLRSEPMDLEASGSIDDRSGIAGYRWPGLDADPETGWVQPLLPFEGAIIDLAYDPTAVATGASAMAVDNAGNVSLPRRVDIVPDEVGPDSAQYRFICPPGDLAAVPSTLLGHNPEGGVPCTLPGPNPGMSDLSYYYNTPSAVGATVEWELDGDTSDIDRGELRLWENLDRVAISGPEGQACADWSAPGWAPFSHIDMPGDAGLGTRAANATGLTEGGCYRWTIRYTDRVGHEGPAHPSYAAFIDRTSPALTIEAYQYDRVTPCSSETAGVDCSTAADSLWIRLTNTADALSGTVQVRSGRNLNSMSSWATIDTSGRYIDLGGYEVDLLFTHYIQTRDRADNVATTQLVIDRRGGFSQAPQLAAAALVLDCEDLTPEGLDKAFLTTGSTIVWPTGHDLCFIPTVRLINPGYVPFQRRPVSSPTSVGLQWLTGTTGTWVGLSNVGGVSPDTQVASGYSAVPPLASGASETVAATLDYGPMDLSLANVTIQTVTAEFSWGIDMPTPAALSTMSADLVNVRTGEILGTIVPAIDPNGGITVALFDALAPISAADLRQGNLRVEVSAESDAPDGFTLRVDHGRLTASYVVDAPPGTANFLQNRLVRHLGNEIRPPADNELTPEISLFGQNECLRDPTPGGDQTTPTLETSTDTQVPIPVGAFPYVSSDLEIIDSQVVMPAMQFFPKDGSRYLYPEEMRRGWVEGRLSGPALPTGDDCRAAGMAPLEDQVLRFRFERESAGEANEFFRFRYRPSVVLQWYLPLIDDPDHGFPRHCDGSYPATPTTDTVACPPLDYGAWIYRPEQPLSLNIDIRNFGDLED